jgi:hypothetical protein
VLLGVWVGWVVGVGWGGGRCGVDFSGFGFFGIPCGKWLVGGKMRGLGAGIVVYGSLGICTRGGSER